MAEDHPRLRGAITIRAYQPRDYPGGIEMYGEFRRFHQRLQESPNALYRPIRQEFDGILSELRENGGIWVAERGFVLAGFVTVRRADPGGAEIPYLYVRGRHRGRGVGQRLVETAVGWAREQGRKWIRAVAVVENPDALEFFTRIGFARKSPESRELDREL